MSSPRTLRSKPIAFFGGLSVMKNESGMAVDAVLPGGPAEHARLKSGDLIVSVRNRPVSASNLQSLLKRTNSMKVVRGSKTLRVTLKAANRTELGLLLVDKVIDGKTYARRVCDASCNCASVDDTSAICSIWYLLKGNGPNGGILLEKHCTSNSAGGGKEKTCSTNEYF